MFHHCSSASLCTWRFPAPHPLHTPRQASSPRTPSCSCLHAYQPPKSTSSWSQTARTLALTPPHVTFHRIMARLHLEHPETFTKKYLTSTVMHALRLYYRWAAIFTHWNVQWCILFCKLIFQHIELDEVSVLWQSCRKLYHSTSCVKRYRRMHIYPIFFKKLRASFNPKTTIKGLLKFGFGFQRLNYSITKIL